MNESDMRETLSKQGISLLTTDAKNGEKRWHWQTASGQTGDSLPSAEVAYLSARKHLFDNRGISIPALDEDEEMREY